MLKLFLTFFGGIYVIVMATLLMIVAGVNDRVCGVVDILLTAILFIVFIHCSKKAYFQVRQDIKKAKEDRTNRKKLVGTDCGIGREQIANKIAENKFRILFGFEPKYVSEKRYEKEVLLKLSFLANKLNECGKKITAKNSFISRFMYGEFQAKYQESFCILEKFSPDFAAKLPHWSELKYFVEKWCEEQREA